MRAERKWFAAILIIPASLCLSVPMRAADVTVGCPGGSGGTYPSINAALNMVGQTGPHTITVTGTCAESVSLFNARSILITAPTPGGATIVGLQDTDTFDIGLSQDITLQNLEIRGNAASSVGAGVSIFNDSQVSIFASNIHDNPDGGVSAVIASQVVIRNTTIQNNTPGDAIDVLNNSSADIAGTTIKNNAFGVFLQDLSNVVFRRQNFIQNNGDVAIQAVDLSQVRFQSSDPALFTTIQGHNVDHCCPN
jgi:Right handed beta helix region